MSNPHIAQIIFGTAGHVDHGKTSLVIALTSFNTDRHPEERTRGISIDFAVAPYTSKDGTIIGIVDIPGHTDFIKNAVSGVSGIDVVLLVIASDDGIMPQTKEHLLIARELGATLIIPVITKIDLSNQESLSELKTEVELLIDSYGCRRTKTVLTSSVTKDGLEELKSVLDETIAKYQISSSPYSFRMFIRACFSGKGFGNIVTGIPDSGTATINNTCEVISANSDFPQKTIIKHIENYRYQTNVASQHISSAINLKEVAAEHLERGAILCTPGIYEQSKSILARITAYDTMLKNNFRATFHLGTMRREVMLFFLDVKSIEAGETAMVQIKSDIPMALRAGDRFILRTETTVAGGIIISRNGKLPRRSLRPKYNEQANKAYKQLGEKDGCAVAELLTSANVIVNNKDLYKYSLGDTTTSDRLSLYEIGKQLWLNLYKLEDIKLKSTSILERYHKNKPINPGIQIKLFLQMLGSNAINVENFNSAKVEAFLKDSIPEVKVQDGIISLQSFTIALSEKETKIIDTIKQIVQTQNFTSKGSLEKELSIDSKSLAKLIRILEAQKSIRALDKEIYSTQFIEELKKSMHATFGNAPFTLSDFRTLSTLSRNYAVPLLEHFDSIGFTKRSGDMRNIVG